MGSSEGEPSQQVSGDEGTIPHRKGGCELAVHWDCDHGTLGRSLGLERSRLPVNWTENGSESFCTRGGAAALR